MKKILFIVLITLLSFTSFSCKPKNKTTKTSVTTTIVSEELISITFKQEGENDIVKYVKKGNNLTDIPTPKSITGYDLSWDKLAVDFTNITEPLVVNVVKTKKTFTITLDLNGGTLDSSTTITTKYDDSVNLPTPVKGESDFVGWYLGDEKINSTFTYNYTENITLKAKYSDGEVWTPLF